MKQVASLRYGVIFKKAFSKPHIFKAFVKDFLDIELDIDAVETEKSFSPVVGRVDSRFDLFAEDKQQRAIVDIQHERYTDHYHRFLHYHCAALLEQVASAEDYQPELQVFTIVVLTSGDKHKVDIAKIDFDPKDRHGNALGEISHKVLYLCPKYVSDETPEPYREWLRAIDDSLDEEIDEQEYQKSEILEIFNLIEKDQTTPQEYARMKDEYSAGKLIEDTRQQGVKEGMAKGIEKGMEKGMEKGQKVQALNTAKILRSEGLELSFIAKATGLSLAELHNLDALEDD